MQRSQRIAEEIKKIIAEAIRSGIKDPRIPLMASVTEVQLTRDLSLATIYVSCLAAAEEKKQMMAALDRSRGFLRRELAGKMRLRVVPELRFRLDESIENGIRMSKLIDEVLAEDAAKEEARKRAEIDEA